MRFYYEIVDHGLGVDIMKSAKLAESGETFSDENEQQLDRTHSSCLTRPYKTVFLCIIQKQ